MDFKGNLTVLQRIFEFCIVKNINRLEANNFMQNGNHEELLTALYNKIEELNNKVETLNKFLNTDHVEKEWLTIAEAAKFAGVSQNTFKKLRNEGLKISVIDGVKRINKYELNSFLKKFAVNFG